MPGLQEKRAAQAAERAGEEARELKQYRSQFTFKVCLCLLSTSCAIHLPFMIPERTAALACFKACLLGHDGERRTLQEG